jgi:hypothetical protein
MYIEEAHLCHYKMQGLAHPLSFAFKYAIIGGPRGPRDGWLVFLALLDQYHVTDRVVVTGAARRLWPPADVNKETCARRSRAHRFSSGGLA